MIRRTVKVVAILAIWALLCPIVAYHALAAQTSDQFLLRVEIENPGETVKISVPLSLLETLFDVLPKEIRKLADENGLTTEALTSEFATLEGEDLVNVENGDETVRIYLEPVDEVNLKETGFVRIHVQSKDGGDNVKVCLPGGLIRLAGETIKGLGITDKLLKEHAHELGLEEFLAEKT